MYLDFDILATPLAGVLAYTVEQRRREIGVRMALGADPNRVLGMIMRRIEFMTPIGGTIDLFAALPKIFSTNFTDATQSCSPAPLWQ